MTMQPAIDRASQRPDDPDCITMTVWIKSLATADYVQALTVPVTRRLEISISLDLRSEKVNRSAKYPRAKSA